MIKTGRVVYSPSHIEENSQRKWLEVYPKYPSEISWYASLDRSRTTYAECEPNKEQSPLLIELSYAKELGLT